MKVNPRSINVFPDPIFAKIGSVVSTPASMIVEITSPIFVSPAFLINFTAGTWSFDSGN